MTKTDLWESIILLLSAILLVPIWMVRTGHIDASGEMLRVYQALQVVLVVSLAVIFIRRIRRVIVAMRENKNRRGPFSF